MSMQPTSIEKIEISRMVEDGMQTHTLQMHKERTEQPRERGAESSTVSDPNRIIAKANKSPSSKLNDLQVLDKADDIENESDYGEEGEYEEEEIEEGSHLYKVDSSNGDEFKVDGQLTISPNDVKSLTSKRLDSFKTMRRSSNRLSYMRTNRKNVKMDPSTKTDGQPRIRGRANTASYNREHNKSC